MVSVNDLWLKGREASRVWSGAGGSRGPLGCSPWGQCDARRGDTQHEVDTCAQWCGTERCGDRAGVAAWTKSHTGRMSVAISRPQTRKQTSHGVKGEPERGAGRPRRRVRGSCGPVSALAAEEDPGTVAAACHQVLAHPSVSRTRPAGGRRGSQEASGRGDAVPWAPYGPTPGPSL